MRRVLLIAWLWLALVAATWAETMPPKPAQYFNDYAGVVSPATVQQLDAQLRQFERDTSNQIVVAVFRKMESDSSIQDYTVRVAQSWKVGQEKRDNGAVLFVFTEPRTMFIQVGYGLEGALPDITCKQIIENEIKPGFKAENFDAGFTSGVTAMMRAARGEYKGTGQVAGDTPKNDSFVVFFILGVIVMVVVAQFVSSWRKATVYSRSGRSFAAGFALDMLGSIFSSSGGSGGGSSSGGGGGGFSGGGGSFGGGGAGGSW